jgi:hypothetical protein
MTPDCHLPGQSPSKHQGSRPDCCPPVQSIRFPRSTPHPIRMREPP